VSPPASLTPFPRYRCGSAREFKKPDGSHVADYSMSCQWDKTWSPHYKLPGDCEWVACLRPALPPPSTHLRANDWDLAPIKFGDLAHYVCQRGFSFEDDPAQLEQTYTCQDGTVPKTTKGFFDVPKLEEDWPKCILGYYCSELLRLLTSPNNQGLTVPRPPEFLWRECAPLSLKFSHKRRP
jgi:hypothetical protein